MPEQTLPGHWSAAASELMRRCDELARCSEEQGRLTRTYLTPAFREAQELVRNWMAEAGLQVRVDAAGNLIGRRLSSRPDAPVFLVGSHLDTVPDAGRYDGMLGVLAGIALARELDESNVDLPFTLDVVAFSEEEGVRFRTPFLGSLALTGQFSPELLQVADRDSVTVREAIRQYGLDPGQLQSAAYPPGSLLGYLEIHIEQGPVLEIRKSALGVVTAIAGQTRLECRLRGEGRHAGTTPMSVRHDALAAAAELVLLAEELGQATEGAVATVGSLEVHPNASNCVPGECGFTLDVRHVEDQVRRQVLEEWLERARAAAERRGVTFVVAARREQASVPCDPILTVLMDQAVAEISGRPGPKLPSGAGHDAMILARVTPIAMLFLRCRGGISHSPEEQVEPGDVAAALAAGANFLRRLAAHPDLARVNRASASSPSLHPSDRSAAAS